MNLCFVQLPIEIYNTRLEAKSGLVMVLVKSQYAQGSLIRFLTLRCTNQPYRLSTCGKGRKIRLMGSDDL